MPDQLHDSDSVDRPGITKCESWQHFKERLNKYSELSEERKRQLIFRGQANAEWPLQSTLDRHRIHRPDLKREACSEQLMQGFRRLAAGMGVGRDQMEPAEWEFLARHHGLPTPFIDWTESPYIAAFFAFDDDVSIQSEAVAVWLLDRVKFAAIGVPDAEMRLTEDHRFIQFNPRAIEQQALFLNVGSDTSSLEDRLGRALWCYRIPSKFRREALADLESMNISPRSMYRDLDAAARGAVRRVLFFEETRDE